MPTDPMFFHLLITIESMYRNFFQFSEKPFDITPDPKFLYLSRAHREVLSSLIYGIRERRGFIVVLGEAGTGKTTLLRSVFDRLGEEVKVANIFNTDVTFDEMLEMVLVDLGLASEKERLTKPEAHHRLNGLAIQQLAAGGNVVIMVDEAQNLDRHCLENLRLLSNLETRKNKLLQIILSGQPELEEKLRRPDLRQLSQRVNLRRYVLPLDEKETNEYIEHRLKIARYQGPPLFTKDAKKLIWQSSRGIPRIINTLCDNALLIGFALKEREISEGPVREAIDDLTRDRFLNVPEPQPNVLPSPAILPEPEAAGRRPGLGLTIFFVACLSLLVGAVLGVLGIQWKGNDGPSFQDIVRPPISGAHESPSGVSAPQLLPEAEKKEKPSSLAALAHPAAEGNQPSPDHRSPLVEAQIEPSSATEQQAVEGNGEKTAEINQKAVPELPLEAAMVVSAKEGDTLFRVIAQHYGRYNKAIERKVLLANPGITDPDRIYVRQRIRMPDLTQEPGT